MPNLNVGKTFKPQHITQTDVEDTITYSEGKNSPVTGAPLHPGRHDALARAKKSNNPFAVLEHMDRKSHSDFTGKEKAPELIFALLQSPLGAYALKIANQKYVRDPMRFVFRLPATAKEVGVTGWFFESADEKGKGEAESATVILDVDKNGYLYVCTAFPEDALPADAKDKAGDCDCFAIQYPGNKKDEILYIYKNDEIRFEMMGGYSKQSKEEVFTFRDK